jgi:hypothetical protein
MISLQIVGRSGEVLGSLALPASVRLIDLEALRQLGACRLVKA